MAFIFVVAAAEPGPGAGAWARAPAAQESTAAQTAATRNRDRVVMVWSPGEAASRWDRSITRSRGNAGSRNRVATVRRPSHAAGAARCAALRPRSGLPYASALPIVPDHGGHRQRSGREHGSHDPPMEC